MLRPKPLLALLALTLTFVAGCSKHSDSSNLPDGTKLVSDAAAAMKTVSTSHVKIDVDGTIGTLPIKQAEGDLKKDGDAKGNVKLDQFGSLVQLDFVVLGSDLYLKFATGGWQKSSGGTSSFPYDPSAILDPDKGVSNLLATTKNAKTEGEENVDGKDTYRVAVDFDNNAASVLVPGVPPGVKGKVWIDKQTKQLVKAVVNSPKTDTLAAATLTVEFTNIDAPVTVSAPA